MYLGNSWHVFNDYSVLHLLVIWRFGIPRLCKDPTPWSCVALYIPELQCLLHEYLSLDKHFSWLLFPQPAPFFTLLEFCPVVFKWTSSSPSQLYFQSHQSFIRAAVLNSCVVPLAEVLVEWCLADRPSAWVCHQLEKSDSFLESYSVPVWNLS